MRLGFKEKVSYGLGAVGKDMVYALTATYILYYFQDLLGVKAYVMGIILLAARVFDAFNDPIMGALVAKTKSKWGKFRPWMFVGTILNSVFLVLLFAVPKGITGSSLAAYACIIYIMWGVTYTMMDIPYWSMVPAFTDGGKERENVSAMARSCAGVGSALIQMLTMVLVPILGKILVKDDEKKQLIERSGFMLLSIIVAILFIVFITITCKNIKEKSTVEMKTVSIKDMFKALIQNDQAMTVVIAIVLVNTAFYVTSNLILYFFKYDFGGTNWNGNYTLFITFGGAMQILSMMIMFPILRRFFDSLKIFRIALIAAIAGYVILLLIAFVFSMNSVYVLFIPAFLIFSANGILTVLTTIFLANTVDYGEIKNGRRDESVIFSMQTFVVKLASGVAALVAAVCLSVFNISNDSGSDISTVSLKASSVVGLRLTMSVIPAIVLCLALLLFIRKYSLDEKTVLENAKTLRKKRDEKNTLQE